MKKIVFFGGSSLLAVNWAKQICLEYDVYLIMHKRKIQLSNVNSVHFENDFETSFIRFIEELKPDYMVNCAALTNVDQCENNPQHAEDINALWPKKLAQLSKRLKFKLIHISTDHLFDGNHSFYSEQSPMSPLNQYAKTKGFAEKNVLHEDDNALIIRTNFFGWGTSYRTSFSDWILKELRAENKITLFTDVFYTPIYITELTRIIHQLLDANLCGVFNVVSNERISKYEFGKLLASRFSLDASLIEPILIEQKAHLILRPKEMSLSIAKMEECLKLTPISLYEQIHLLSEEESLKLAL